MSFSFNTIPYTSTLNPYTYNDYPARKPSDNAIFPKNTQFPIFKSLHEYVFKKIHSWETCLEHFMPSFPFQNKFDQLCQYIDNCFSMPLLHHWLDDNGHGDWHEKLAVCLAKIPLRSARNIVRSLSTIIKMAIAAPAYALVHPLKFPIKLLQYLASFINALTTPETWTKIGTGLIGSALGHAALTSNPLSIIAIGIGSALALSGITLGTLKTALMAPKFHRAIAVGEYVKEQVLQAGEDFLAGFATVAILESVQGVMRGLQKCGRWLKHNAAITASQYNMSRQQAYDFLRQHNLPGEDQFYSGLNYGVYWHVERLYGGNFKAQDLPGARFVFKDIQTRVEQSITYIWESGYMDSSGNYIDGHFKPIITYHPVYEKFFGYELSLQGWVEPPLPELGAAIRLNDKVVPYLGIVNGADKLLEDAVN